MKSRNFSKLRTFFQKGEFLKRAEFFEKEGILCQKSIPKKILVGWCIFIFYVIFNQIQTQNFNDRRAMMNILRNSILFCLKRASLKSSFYKQLKFTNCVYINIFQGSLRF